MSDPFQASISQMWLILFNIYLALEPLAVCTLHGSNKQPLSICLELVLESDVVKQELFRVVGGMVCVLEIATSTCRRIRAVF